MSRLPLASALTSRSAHADTAVWALLNATNNGTNTYNLLLSPRLGDCCLPLVPRRAVSGNDVLSRENIGAGTVRGFLSQRSRELM